MNTPDAKHTETRKAKTMARIPNKMVQTAAPDPDFRLRTDQGPGIAPKKNKNLMTSEKT